MADDNLPVPADQADRRTNRQVRLMFALAGLLALASVLAYALVDTGDNRGSDLTGVQTSNLVIGLTFGAALLLAGIATILWTRTKPNEADEPGERPTLQLNLPPVNRRFLIGGGVASAAALLPAILLLRAIAPAAPETRRHTIWAPGVRLLTDVSHQPVQPADLEVGQLVNVVPESLLDALESGGGHHTERSKSAVVMVRMRARDVVPADGRESWHVDGIIAYSKICTHVGCPMGLYERTTKHLLCPCHQSTFNLADSGAVVFGPATRSLPQLPLAVDDDGYLVAQSDFTEPVGPSYWER